MGISFLYFPILWLSALLHAKSLSESLFIRGGIKPEKHATILLLPQVIW